jgi:error-prone DNA polymerase
VREDDIARLLHARQESGAFRDLGDFAARAGASHTALSLLAWAGACDSLAGGGAYARRTALWQLGIATPSQPVKGGQQLALDLPLPDTPALSALSQWEQMVADYATTSVSIDRHPVGLLRDNLTRQGARSTMQLQNVRHGTNVTVAGLVIARQRPQTANGIIFMLLEDEHGTLNVIVPARLYETSRLTIRTEPLVLVQGRLERHDRGGGASNLLATSITRLNTTTGETAANVKKLHQPTQPTAADDFAAAAPAVTSFGQGRRR